jgi:hypothetical protein
MRKLISLFVAMLAALIGAMLLASNAAADTTPPITVDGPGSTVTWTIISTSCGTGAHLLVSSQVTDTVPGHSYALFGLHNALHEPPDQESNAVMATGDVLTTTFDVAGLAGPFDGRVQDMDGSSISSEQVIARVCPTPVIVDDPAQTSSAPSPAMSTPDNEPGAFPPQVTTYPAKQAPKPAKPAASATLPTVTPNAFWTVVGTSCSGQTVVVTAKVSGAIIGQAYGLYDVAGNRQSLGLVTAHAATFTTTFELPAAKSAYRTNVESKAIGQLSRVRQIGATCTAPAVTTAASPAAFVHKAKSSAIAIVLLVVIVGSIVLAALLLLTSRHRRGV